MGPKLLFLGCLFLILLIYSHIYLQVVITCSLPVFLGFFLHSLVWHPLYLKEKYKLIVTTYLLSPPLSYEEHFCPLNSEMKKTGMVQQKNFWEKGTYIANEMLITTSLNCTTLS